MEKLKKNIFDFLQDLKGSGKFASIHKADFLFPGLEVHGVGEIAYPVNRLQAEALISAAHKAPFGKGRHTIVDTNVRSAWVDIPDSNSAFISSTAFNTFFFNFQFRFIIFFIKRIIKVSNSSNKEQKVQRHP
jgi:hypothetical protein